MSLRDNRPLHSSGRYATPELVTVAEVRTCRDKARRQNQPSSLISLAPWLASEVRIVASVPTARLYSLLMRSMNASTLWHLTRFTVEPPNPPPVILAPRTPSIPEATSTRVSSSFELTS